jgi:hypothetical protein
LAGVGQKHETNAGVVSAEVTNRALPALPKISIRLCESQLLLAKPGLLRMRDSIRRIQQGQDPNPLWCPVDFWELRNFLKGKTRLPHGDPELAEHIVQLWRYLYPVLHRQRKRQRLRLDFIDVSLCALAVRVLDKLVRHRHSDAPRADYPVAARRFLRTLENLRRRAKTATIRMIGGEAYNSLRIRWKQYTRWLRVCVLSCECGKHIEGTKRHYADVIDRVVEIAGRELRAEHSEPPERAILRRWATLLVHNVRRGRVPGVGIRTLLEKPLGASVIRHKMRWRLSKYDKKRIEQ